MAAKDDFELAPPPAASMVEALRGIGYTVETAIADLLDNSISAGARTIWIHFEWDGPHSCISILDNGRGLSEPELFQAMRPGSRSPLEDRDADDLGRFGLGLKTASFSQCRRLTVTSKRNGRRAGVRRWDLDYVARHNEWRLLKSPAVGSEGRLVPLMSETSGTLILWEVLDRVVGEEDVDDDGARRHFQQMIERVRDHLAMVFHRFLTGANPELKLYINGHAKEHWVRPWDPFLSEHLATIPFPYDPIPSRGGRVVVRGFVLPHKERLGDAQHRAAAGPAGWNAQQGFYVYRNRRLLVAGSWLGLGSDRPWTKEEHYKLARIQLDIPNTMDADWKIDVRKSSARPPVSIRKRLRELADQVRKQAREVFSHRGKGQPGRFTEPVVRAWKEVSVAGRLSYRVNRDHPLIASCLANQVTPHDGVVQLIRVLEETVPVHQIWLDAAERPDSHAQPFETTPPAEVATLISAVLQALMKDPRLDEQSARRRLLAMEPFNRFPELVDNLLSRS
jgi:hypothetical protein